jgi:acyl-CoA reductase-like NAD-dependent aldehyde dehydrogenase
MILYSLLLLYSPLSFPYLVAVNSALPAIIAGNAVLLKPSPQTPLAAERFVLALVRAGVPKDIIQVIHMSPSLTSFAVQHTLVDFVSFTGSVPGGHSVVRSAADGPGFTGVGLEVDCSDSAFVHYSSWSG